MKEELVKPFVKSGKEIISQVANIEVTQKDFYFKKEVVLKDNIGIIIGMTGTLKGQVVISLTEDIAKKIASNMMGGMPVAVLDEMAKSAICELGNMILGNAAVGLYDFGASVDITPPSVLQGNHMVYTSSSPEIMCVPFEIEENQIELNLLLEK
ncbi:chemotaxis protein CheX [Caldisalinibacter kiritimatiensis]|uniref:Chemotaxis phosphatase CheX-like domain-containing protein n=1 Tax=Caldisalinibacter kiritimatiensis TaxID=1304284 RepID=R1AY75_9FIRM|nr:chemotaxis protein CheX [Caldisalinibacter kiritimatiensis]EOD01627.1 hypothetical protein L21TH_0298 [Caldisalinibacter kiritimatiensis]